MVECGYMSNKNKGSETHGLSKTRIYTCWIKLRRRCQDKKDYNYNLYGGRGIKVCNRWEKFENFYEDMGDSYSDKLSIDRIDTNGDYTPENCRWATPQEQVDNRRNTTFIEYKGENLPLTTWARRLGVNPSLLRSRINIFKWPLEEVMNPRKRRYNGGKKIKRPDVAERNKRRLLTS
jgi:hypothetical protein